MGSYNSHTLCFNGLYFWWEPNETRTPAAVALRAGTSLFLRVLIESVHAQRIAAQRKKENGTAAILLILECVLLRWSDG